jgi:hypothetical protein
LKWFEGDTQKRSIGISLVTANWDSFPELHRTWLGVLANQAVYLLAVSGQGSKPHEITNLKRIMAVLIQDAKRPGGLPPELETIARLSLREALDARVLSGRTTGGVDISSIELNSWWQEFGFNSWP